MITERKNLQSGADTALEDLLGQAPPRIAPPRDDESVVRAAVHAEWAAMTNKRKVRRQLLSYAAAAIVLLALAMTVNGLRGVGEPAAQVASIDKSFGSIYVLGEQSELRTMQDGLAVTMGQIIVTGDDSGLGLNWANRGSLRVDENTRIEFTSSDEIFLRSGRVYFDSQPSDLAAGIDLVSQATVPDLTVHTEHGDVKHMGTQYMTHVDNNGVTVSVREGRVSVNGLLYPETAVEGQQLTIAGSARPALTNISVYGDAWRWVELTAPAAILDGRTVYEFLLWVGRETGMELSFDSSEAEQLARNERLMGTVDTEPTRALGIWMLGVDLDWRIDDGFIHIASAGPDR